MRKNIILFLVTLVLVLTGVFFISNNKKSGPSPTPDATPSSPPPAQSLFPPVQPPPPTASVSIIITDNGYKPKTITIRKGTAVTFENRGITEYWPASNIHPTHEIYSEFDPRKPIPPGESWTFVFDKEGVWRFHDHLYPTFAGLITVE
ncbi:MAG: hypothetical protein A2939_04175 [Parcubacteria group bacterium RIFCSPLOWO2_01_FULL_48_18]|nr:MAG: hypothetical protein A2939_04175 [Parcubacteria group bacterium RIFCSPLOWO2_01_FULL_48_18]OHB24434.1 MAG: hypothetical protein A3J67_02245 [Parcubacteria group bacterium RIFCSPHIGHO2_02_FULL_48_10b]